MMVDAKAARVDYVSPNIERLLGIPEQKVRQDIEVLKNLHQKDAPDREIDFLAGLISGSSANGTLILFISKQGNTAGSTILPWAVRSRAGASTFL